AHSPRSHTLCKRDFCACEMLKAARAVRVSVNGEVPDVFVVRSRVAEEIGLRVRYEFAGLEELRTIYVSLRRSAYDDPASLSSADVAIDREAVRVARADGVVRERVVIRGRIVERPGPCLVESRINLP